MKNEANKTLPAQTERVHGGRIRVESKQGKGTTFTVRLPVG